MLALFFKKLLALFSKNGLHSSKNMLAGGAAFPAPVRLTGLPVCRVSKPCCPAYFSEGASVYS